MRVEQLIWELEGLPPSADVRVWDEGWRVTSEGGDDPWEAPERPVRPERPLKVVPDPPRPTRLSVPARWHWLYIQGRAEGPVYHLIDNDRSRLIWSTQHQRFTHARYVALCGYTTGVQVVREPAEWKRACRLCERAQDRDLAALGYY